MKRFLFAALAAAALYTPTGTARAAGPLNGVAAPGIYSPAPMGGMESRYGVLPWLRKGFFFRHTGGCEGCGPAAVAPVAPVGAGVPGIPQAGQPGGGMPGTLVFPNHPFARSPRDFFMWEK